MELASYKYNIQRSIIIEVACTVSSVNTRDVSTRYDPHYVLITGKLNSSYPR